MLVFLFILCTAGSPIPTSLVLSPIAPLTYPDRAYFQVYLLPLTINQGHITFYNHGVTPLGNLTIVRGGVVHFILNNTHAGTYIVTANYTDARGTYHSNSSAPRRFVSLPANVYLSAKINAINPPFIYATQIVSLTVNLTTAKGQGPYHTTLIATWNNSVIQEWDVNLTQVGQGIQYKTFTKIRNFSLSFPYAGRYPLEISTAQSLNYHPGSFVQNLTVKVLPPVCGFKMPGQNQGDNSGISVSSAGDINKDGYSDFIVGADLHGGGRGYVVFGGPHVGSSGVIPLGSLNGSNGFILVGEGGECGASVSSAGDLNKDGYGDLIIGAPNYNSGTGRTYVVFGGETVGSNGSIALGSLNGTDGFILNGENQFDSSGGTVSYAGDVNGDGYSDVIIGAMYYGPGFSEHGRSYVVFGGPNLGSTGPISLGSLNGTNGFIIKDSLFEDFGGTVSSAGDINKDGYSDLLIGASGHSGFNGAGYVVFGGRTVGSNGFVVLSSLNGSNGFIITGGIHDAGTAVSSAGDINNDGYSDVMITNQGVINGTFLVYLILGSATVGSNGSIEVQSLNGSNGFILVGEHGTFTLGSFLVTQWIGLAGDLNKDNFSDIIIGSTQYPNSTFAGRVYVLYGGSKVGSTGSVLLGNLDGANGFILDGDGDAAGISVNSAGDINKDGYSDLIIGAFGYNNEQGRTYVMFGGQNQVWAPLSGFIQLSRFNASICGK